MPVQAKGQVRPEKSAYHSIALLTESFEKDISLLLSRACSTLDKIVDRCALTIYPYSLDGLLDELSFDARSLSSIFDCRFA